MDTNTIILTLIPVVSTVGAAVWTVYKYFSARSADRRRLDFEAFHKMVGSLPQGGSHTISPEAMLATIYELRNYPAYFTITRRILEMYSTRMPSDGEFTAIKREIEETLEYIRTNSSVA